MQHPLPIAPSFYLTARQPLRPGVILLAIVVAAGAVGAIVYGLSHSGQARLNSVDQRSASGAASAADDDDDPNQIDTIVLGDPGDAPRPARRGDHVSSVHPTILITLPRSGDKVGLIPDNPAGRLLYDWLAAFNRASASGLANALPNPAPASVAAAQIALRKQTGGFNLLSAKEVQPGVLVFRLRDQTPEAVEVLGTLQVRAESSPATIASFSLRAVPSTRLDSASARP
jgi:hypothetical protein